MLNTTTSNDFTTKYTYGNDDQEYVFSCKGRPFAVLVSSHFPTPTTTLLDYDLVKSLDLKITDLQCRKFNFAGNKFRILGRVSTAIQCVRHGKIGGDFHVKAFVVADLNTKLDTHCVASARMQQQMAKRDTAVTRSDDECEADPAESPPAATPSRSPTPAAPARSPSPAPATPSRSPPATGTPRSPPGFPSTPQYRVDDVEDVHKPPTCFLPQHGNFIPADQIAADLRLTPLAANLYLMNVLFNNADVQSEVANERKLLSSGSVGGNEDKTADVFTFTTKGGYVYRTGHGRQKCTRERCELQRHLPRGQYNPQLPNNCGLHEQWCLPEDFWYCGLQCRGGFCDCLKEWDKER